MPGAMAEAEVKIRLTAEEFARLPGVLADLGFSPTSVHDLTDHYLDYTRSSPGGYDLTRLRAAGDTWLLTEKHWVRDAGGQAVRLEDEREITAAEAANLLREATPATLKKRRWEYHGPLAGSTAAIALDRLVLSGRTLYFLECELLVPRDQAAQARENILTWMHAHLPVHDYNEAPSMLELLLAHEGNRDC